MQRCDSTFALALQRHFVWLDAAMLSKRIGYMESIVGHIGRCHLGLVANGIRDTARCENIQIRNRNPCLGHHRMRCLQKYIVLAGGAVDDHHDSERSVAGRPMDDGL
jgi:hypothetical protein